MRKTVRQQPYLRTCEDAGRFLSFRALTNQVNRITVKEFVSTGMVEQNGHHATDLRATALRKW